MTTAQTVDFDDVRSAYRCRFPDGNWFSKGALRFFRSRFPRTAYKVGYSFVFVSSEQGPYGPRAYSVRLLDSRGVTTIGDFNAYTRREAQTFAKWLAGA